MRGLRRLYSSEEARRVAGVTYRQLDSWTRSRLVRPEQEAAGSGSARRWAPAQVVELRVIGDLRRAGVPMQRIRRAVSWLRKALPKLAAPLAELSFVTDGRRIFYLSPNPGKLVDVLAGGQTVLTVPLGQVVEQVGIEGAAAKAGRVQYDLPEQVEPGEDGYFVARCPVLRGCYSQGRTREQAHRNLREAMALYLEVVEEEAARSRTRGR